MSEGGGGGGIKARLLVFTPAIRDRAKLRESAQPIVTRFYGANITSVRGEESVMFVTWRLR